MLVTSQREAARQLGVSHTALQKAERAGRITPAPGGGWDIAQVRAALAASADPARTNVPPKRERASAVLGDAAEAGVAPMEPEQPHPLPPTNDGLPRSGATSFHDARTAHEILKAQERRLSLDERRGRLVDKARAMILVHRLAREERDATLAWPARVAAELAAELGVDPHRLQTLMDGRLRQHLAERNGVGVTIA
jgi:hypothetical protein